MTELITDFGGCLVHLPQPDPLNSKSQVIFIRPLSAGNVDQAKLDRNHLARSDIEPVHDPAQAWNALTVGAHTEKVVISDPLFRSWNPVSPRGELSPWSTTSVLFEKQWPIKPEVVFEGGNAICNAADDVDTCDDLSLLTTYFRPTLKSLVSTHATSAATAQAARLCASILAAYPEFWPETIRALVIHSAQWTKPMQACLDTASGKTARGKLVRRYGYGVPNLERALKSATNAVTLIAEDSIRPFENCKTREIHLHNLPWPRDVLAGLGNTPVRVRVTLSYFVEPNPGRRGWKNKHRYQSHGLRFEVSGPTESRDEFRKRLNKKALEEGEKRPSNGADNEGWYLGPGARNAGSVHSDVLEGSAADIAERGLIAIYPITGWWKDRKNRDRSEHGARYSLVVSIETDDVEADLWTPISVAVENAATIAVPTAVETRA